MQYYPVIMANVVQYIYYTAAGSPFLAILRGFTMLLQTIKSSCFWWLPGDILTVLSVWSDIKGGIEKHVKFFYRHCLLFWSFWSSYLAPPGIMEGIGICHPSRFFSVGKSEALVEAAVADAVAIGAGPGYLITFWEYCSDKRNIRDGTW